MTAHLIADVEATDWRTAPFQDAGFMPLHLDLEPRACGTLMVRSNLPLIDLDWNLPRALGQVTAQHPDRMAVARRAVIAP